MWYCNCNFNITQTMSVDITPFSIYFTGDCKSNKDCADDETCKEAFCKKSALAVSGCKTDIDCNTDMTCTNRTCVKATCSNICEENAWCKVKDHIDVCQCHQGYIGNPEIRCGTNR